ncbi:MAG TPA: pyridoxal phosphate-dependent aminotransferase [Vicinamibacterales bacterium]|nr:pyridoxal phosphate-dependent aminotransferase [Vicinamibacterales bacterium]
MRAEYDRPDGMFSSRVPSDLRINRVTEAIERFRASGRRLLDLTITNPTRAGFHYEPDLLSGFASSAGLTYSPSPLGQREAREAVSADFARRGVTVQANRVVLTASTSEAYSMLFKLLCEPAGDAVLVPVPSYPLFDHLARLDGIRPVPYRLEYHCRWTLDPVSLEEASASRFRAVVAVTPNNPTGSCCSADELALLAGTAAAHDAALVLDEVFADYPLTSGPVLGPSVPGDVLSFRLGGLSKTIGLPQVKLAWIGVAGPERLASEAMARLELIGDTYLSVSTPVQLAAGDLLRTAAPLRSAILARVRANYDCLQALALRHSSVSVLRADAGWSAVLQVSARQPEEDLVLELIEQDGVLVHPGYFFDFAHEAFVVISLLPEVETFTAGVSRLLERVDA